MPTASAETLSRIARALLAAAGSSHDEAARVANNLVEANLMGHDSHGIVNLPAYISYLLDGRMVANQQPKILRAAGPFLVVDGGRGLGQSVGRLSLEVAIARCRDQGVVVLAIRNSGHLGRIGAFGEQCAEAGLVSLHFANVSGHPPFVAPFGGREARLSTNPFCFALPTGRSDAPIVLDCATSKVAWGKLKIAYNKGTRVGEGLMLDETGKATDDPSVMVPEPRGAMLAFGEHKGSGIGLICELLGGALAGGDTIHPHYPRSGATINSMLSILIDPARLGDAGAIVREVDAVLDYVRSASPIDPHSPLVLAGDPERRMRQERRVHGIPLDAATWVELEAGARALHVDPKVMKFE